MDNGKLSGDGWGEVMLKKNQRLSSFKSKFYWSLGCKKFSIVFVFEISHYASRIVWLAGWIIQVHFIVYHSWNNSKYNSEKIVEKMGLSKWEN